MRDRKRRIESIIQKVKQVIETEDWECKDLFVTERGNQLGRQLKEVEEFTIKGMFMTFMGILRSIFPMLDEWFQSDTFKEKMREGIKDQDTEISKAIQTILTRYPNILTEIDYNSLFKTEDCMRFFAYFVFAVSAYLDAFVEETTKNIIEWILKKANNYEENVKRKSITVLRKIFKTERTTNPYYRIRALLNSFGVSKEFTNGLKAKNFGYLEPCFLEFIKLRNTIAHKDPYPRQAIFVEFPALKSYLEDYVVIDLQEEYSDIPKELQRPFKVIIDFIKENGIIFATVNELADIIIIFLALTDNIIEMELKTFDS